MDEGLSLSEKLPCFRRSIADGIVLEIVDHCEEIWPETCSLINIFSTEAEDEDLMAWIDVKVGEIVIPSLKVECKLQAYLHDRCGIKVAFINGEYVGLLVYNLILGRILVVRAALSLPRARRFGVVKDLINSCGNIKKLIFQTKKSKPPQELFKLTKNSIKIDEDEHLITWEMDWRNDGNTK